MEKSKHIFFIGIGGSGMSGIAKVLLDKGYMVSGSDIHETDITNKLIQSGAKINYGHRAENLSEDIDTVVLSSAIPRENPEYCKAIKKNLCVLQRAEVLDRLMTGKKGIAVAGAHGKTTTTSMIAKIFDDNGLQPTIIIGGELRDIGGNAKYGQGEYLIAEADESDGSFLKLHPWISVVTNIEDDHLDYYGSKENIEKAFIQFVLLTPSDGYAVLCLDDPAVKNVLPQLKGKINIITYGFDHSADCRAEKIKLDGEKTTANIYFHERSLGIMELGVPGRHNIQNALAAIAVSHICGVDFNSASSALIEFKGANRRFQKIGTFNDISIYDDYAHHPTEIKATLTAARTLKPKRIVAVFQPHRFSRTKLLLKEFGNAFSEADLIIVNEIYPAGEKQIPGINAKLIIQQIMDKTGIKAEYVYHREDISKMLLKLIKPGDLVMTIGAGDIYLTAKELYCLLKTE